MRILFISPRQCWPAVTGARLREYHLAKALGRRAELTHVFFAERDEAPGPAELPFCHAIIAAPPPRRYTAVKVVRGLAGRWPLPVVNYYSAEMAAALRGILERQEFDLVHLDSLHMGAYIPLLERYTRAPIVFDWHNIESEAMLRYSLSAPSAARRAYAALTARRLAAFEEYALRKGLGHAVCSERERRELARCLPSARLAVVENGVDTRAFDDVPGGPSPRRHRILFVGSMNYAPNIDAAVSFANSVWPELRNVHPGWLYTVAGSNPAPAVLSLRVEPGIEVTGTVDDLRPYYREAVAAIVPLRSGGGTRLKILEAMAAGTPVISTALGAEGLAVSPGKDILIADSTPEWIEHLNALARQDALWTSLAGAGRELARSRYDWEKIGDALYDTYAGWLDAVKQ